MGGGGLSGMEYENENLNQLGLISESVRNSKKSFS